MEAFLEPSRDRLIQTNQGEDAPFNSMEKNCGEGKENYFSAFLSILNLTALIAAKISEVELFRFNPTAWMGL